ncbi:unnamed protein product, partial [Choristocarpus tenellus]
MSHNNIKALSNRLTLHAPRGATKQEMIDRIKEKYAEYRAKDLMSDDFIAASRMPGDTFPHSEDLDEDDNIPTTRTNKHKKKRKVLLPRTETFPTLVGVILKNFDKNFFLHHNTSGWQARHYKQSIARLRAGQAVLVVDFQSQYSHGHQDLTQQEFFNVFLTAMFPAAVWMRDFKRGGLGGGRTWAHSLVFLSQDTSQDNEFMQHVLEKLINEFLKPMAQEYGQELRVLHIWTDRCGSQFKNRWQMEWVSKAFGRH